MDAENQQQKSQAPQTQSEPESAISQQPLRKDVELPDNVLTSLFHRLPVNQWMPAASATESVSEAVVKARTFAVVRRVFVLRMLQGLLLEGATTPQKQSDCGPMRVYERDEYTGD
ncbi:hypothetical protein AYO21_04706 [Fonsecaea monophora]|uniref:Uncharacterized protein n=1 Tax=Fonsecaea monophora TaxID=254056 RepID=A0A177F9Z8_9EURO|nr:hypothetical protein AYO21_04706 [Fonsecaea monophora]OAG41093.1 hypothetical protein AYO21_04706 [Fonsecaea monophora]